VNKREEVSTKIERLVAMLKANKLGGVLLSSQHNFSWLTAGGSNGIDLSRDAGAGALLVRDDGKSFVLANRIEMQRLLKEHLEGTEFEPLEFAWEDEKASGAFLPNRATELLTNGATMGSDLFVGPTATLIESEVARCRYQLTAAEIERFRSLGSDAAGAIERLVRELRPGETEREIARQVTDTLAAHKIRAIVVLVAADDRIAKYRHPVPTDLPWEKVLMVVVCGQRQGLIASLTRIICLGDVPDKLQSRTEATARVNAQLLAATRPGASGAELFRVAADAYAMEGFANEEHLHHQGGATGYRTREWFAHPASGEIVQVNQAFAWNPSITGTKVEETILCGADGIEVITQSPGWPQIPTVINGREYPSPGILQL
jgi:antitoxin VapB